MAILIEKFGPLLGGLTGYLFLALRYTLMAGLPFLVFYIIKKHHWGYRKIQPKFPSSRAILSEIRHSIGALAIFTLLGTVIFGLTKIGLGKIYTDISALGYGYLVFSAILLIVAHDTYFYWMHRLMHHPWVYRKVHLVHHKSYNPTPWASLSFHPIEAFLEYAVAPVMVLLIPLHPVVLFFFATWSFAWNVVGHLGFEVFPAWLLRHPLGRWLNTSTHHNMHHEKGRHNYGLYFNFWDRVMGTNHPGYIQRFEAVAGKKQNKPVVAVARPRPPQSERDGRCGRAKQYWMAIF